MFGSGKIDLIMWSKHGPPNEVLQRIKEVIPESNINQKLLVVDNFADVTDESYRKHGWNMLINEGKGISGAANTAFKRVETEFFISFEDDLVLASDWWRKIPRLLVGKTVVASGVRIPDKPLAIVKLQEYTTERYRIETRHKTSFVYGKTLDNTIYATEVVQQLGGFPHIKINAGVDNVLTKRLHDNGYNWAVDFNVKSIHLRSGLKQELKHAYWYGTCHKELKKIMRERGEGFSSILLRTGFSFIRGLHVAYKKRCWQIAYIYPLIRIAIFLGVTKGYLCG